MYRPSLDIVQRQNDGKSTMGNKDTVVWDYLSNLKESLAPCYTAMTTATMYEYYTMDEKAQQEDLPHRRVKKIKEGKNKINNNSRTKKSNPVNTSLSGHNDIIKRALITINHMRQDHPAFSRELYAAKLDLTILSNLIMFHQFIRENKRSLSGEKRINVLERSDAFLKTSMYELYRLKEDYGDTTYFKHYVEHQEMKHLSDIVFELEKRIHLTISSYYDRKYGPKAKYLRRVDPNDFVVIAATDRITKGLQGEESIKQAIFNFIKRHVWYHRDPNWKNDWVQPPALTLLSGRGDCEDQAILLASMFARAGINDVKLCEAAIEGKTRFDHMYASVGEEAWDTLASNVTQYRHKCMDIQSALRQD
jgi:nicotinamide riboside kinase